MGNMGIDCDCVGICIGICWQTYLQPRKGNLNHAKIYQARYQTFLISTE